MSFTSQQVEALHRRLTARDQEIAAMREAIHDYNAPQTGEIVLADRPEDGWILLPADHASRHAPRSLGS